MSSIKNIAFLIYKKTKKHIPILLSISCVDIDLVWVWWTPGMTLCSASFQFKSQYLAYPLPWIHPLSVDIPTFHTSLDFFIPTFLSVSPKCGYNHLPFYKIWGHTHTIPVTNPTYYSFRFFTIFSVRTYAYDPHMIMSFNTTWHNVLDFSNMITPFPIFFQIIPITYLHLMSFCRVP